MLKSDTKTVLFYTDTPLIGGAENQMYLLAKFLDKEKYKIILICSDYKNLDEWVKKFENEGIEAIRLNVFHKHDPRHYFQLKEIIKQRQIDIMHVHIWNPASCRYALMLGIKYNIPLVITEHDPFELSKLKTFLKKRFLKNVNHVIAVSNSNQKLLIKLFPELKNRISTIHNGIDVTWFESQLLSFNDIKRKEYRKNELSVDNNSKIILTVAELHERKVLNYLIKAFPLIKKEIQNSKIVIAGIGPKKEELEKLAEKENVKNNIMFLGFRKDIHYLMKAADIFILPSIKEAFGLVLLEAMAAKLPIIASNVGGIPEIIVNNKNGELIPPHDEKLLAKTVIKLLKNSELCQKYVRTGFKILKKSFDAKIMAKKTEKIYDKIVNIN
jgi:glycosyltransferase involved in cell wall biosynthesis